jgi:NAD+ kinase
MKFSLFANIKKDADGSFLKEVCQYIESLGSEVIHSEIMSKRDDIDIDKVRGSDVIITLGGDGTLLSIAQKTVSLRIPLVGINLGSLGFLTQIEKNEYRDMLLEIIHKNYTTSIRLMLHADIMRKNKVIFSCEALNDIVVSRKVTGDTVTVAAQIDGSIIDHYDGDGLIISTPTGSTGYQMSAGGPVSDPEADIFMMTPICPHMMHKQSYVIKDKNRMDLLIEETDDFECCFNYDGISVDIKGGDIISVFKSDKSIIFLKFAKTNFYENLINKIYYRGN